MGRHAKIGLNYFPLDVAVDDDVELLEAECGLEGFAILVKIWQKIYSTGYYIEWKEDNALLFSRKINSGVNQINSVVNACLRRSIFDKTMYEKYSILTSSGVQKRYFKACADSKRKNITGIKEYLLLTPEFIELITEFIALNPEESAQSRVNKNKEDKKKEDKIKINISFETFWNLYDKKNGSKPKLEKKWNKLTDQVREKIIDRIPRYKTATPDKQYRKNPETYLNNQSWEDEIIENAVKPVNGRSYGFQRVSDDDLKKQWEMDLDG